MITHPIEPEDESLPVLMHEGYTTLPLCFLHYVHHQFFSIDLLFFASSLLHDLDFMDGISVYTHTHPPSTPQIDTTLSSYQQTAAVRFRSSLWPFLHFCFVFHAPHIIALLMHSKIPHSPSAFPSPTKTPKPHELSRTTPHSLILGSFSSHCTLDITHTFVRSYIRPL